MSNVELFSKAANFMIKYLKDINLARKTLFKGIRMHNYSQHLYLELFRIELEHAAKKRRLLFYLFFIFFNIFVGD